MHNWYKNTELARNSKRHFKFSLDILVGLGLHLGSPKRNWCDRSEKYLLGYRQGFSIFNLAQTSFYLRRANKFIEQAVSMYARGFFYGFMKDSNEAGKIKLLADLGQVVSHNIWHGGFVTNTRRFSKFVFNSGKRFGFVVCFKYDITNYPAMREALRLKLPFVCPVDSNSNPDYVPYPIPGSSSGTSNVIYFGQLFSSSVFSGIVNRIVSFIRKGKLWSGLVHKINTSAHTSIFSALKGRKPLFNKLAKRKKFQYRLLYQDFRRKFKFLHTQRSLRRFTATLLSIRKKKLQIRRRRVRRRRRTPAKMRRFYRGRFSLTNRWTRRAMVYRFTRRYVRARNYVSYRRRRDLKDLYVLKYLKRKGKKRVPTYLGRRGAKIRRLRKAYMYRIKKLRGLKPAKFLKTHIKERAKIILKSLYANLKDVKEKRTPVKGNISKPAKAQHLNIIRLNFLFSKIELIGFFHSLKHSPFHVSKLKPIVSRLRFLLYQAKRHLVSRASQTLRIRYVQVSKFSTHVRRLSRFWLRSRWFLSRVKRKTFNRNQRTYRHFFNTRKRKLKFNSYLVYYPKRRSRKNFINKIVSSFPVKFGEFFKFFKFSLIPVNPDSIPESILYGPEFQRQRKLFGKSYFFRSISMFINLFRFSYFGKFKQFFQSLHFLSSKIKHKTNTRFLVSFIQFLRRYRIDKSRNYGAFVRETRTKAPLKNKIRLFSKLHLKGQKKKLYRPSPQMRLGGKMRKLRALMARLQIAKIRRAFNLYARKVHLFQPPRRIRSTMVHSFRRSTGSRRRKLRFRFPGFTTRRPKQFKMSDLKKIRSSLRSLRNFRARPNLSSINTAWSPRGSLSSTRYYRWKNTKSALSTLRSRTLTSWWGHIVATLPRSVWSGYKFPRKWRKFYLPRFVWNRFKNFRSAYSPLTSSVRFSKRNTRHLITKVRTPIFRKRSLLIKQGRFVFYRLFIRTKRWSLNNSRWVGKTVGALRSLPVWGWGPGRLTKFKRQVYFYRRTYSSFLRKNFRNLPIPTQQVFARTLLFSRLRSNNPRRIIRRFDGISSANSYKIRYRAPHLVVGLSYPAKKKKFKKKIPLNVSPSKKPRKRKERWLNLNTFKRKKTTTAVGGSGIGPLR